MELVASQIAVFLSDECKAGSLESREEALLDLECLYLCSRRLAESLRPAVIESVQLLLRDYIEEVLETYSRLLVEEQYLTAEVEPPPFTEEEQAESLAKARELWAAHRGDNSLSPGDERELARRWLLEFEAYLDRRMNSPSVRWERSLYNRREHDSVFSQLSTAW